MKLTKTRMKQLEECERLLDQAKAIVDEVWQEEEGAYSDKSERWQESERGEESKEKIDTLESLGEEIQAAIDSLNALRS